MTDYSVTIRVNVTTGMTLDEATAFYRDLAGDFEGTHHVTNSVEVEVEHFKPAPVFDGPPAGYLDPLPELVFES